MDIGKRKEDYNFYEGYEGEKEVVISLPDIEYHIWEGYFCDIFGKPQLAEKGWKGFTRDYNELINAFEDDCVECAINPEEYLRDLMIYRDRSFSYTETADVLKCLITIMADANENNICVLVRVN